MFYFGACHLYFLHLGVDVSYLTNSSSISNSSSSSSPSTDYRNWSLSVELIVLLLWWSIGCVLVCETTVNVSSWSFPSLLLIIYDHLSRLFFCIRFSQASIACVRIVSRIYWYHDTTSHSIRIVCIVVVLKRTVFFFFKSRFENIQSSWRYIIPIIVQITSN